jgi:hypothetical protein
MHACACGCMGMHIISGPHSGKYEDYGLLRCDTVQSGRHVLTVWRNMLTSSSEQLP